MANVYWEFSVAYSTGDKLSPNSIGIVAASAEDVVEFGSFSGFDVNGWDRDGISRRKIEVNELETSERLKKLLTAIEEKYGFKPSQTKIVPVADRNQVFGLTKRRVYMKDEIDSTELLYISFVENIIADFCDRTEEEVNAERYAIKKGNKNKVVPLGIISPFLAIAVTGEMKIVLERAGLVGLRLERVINSDDIWKLTSSITMPRACLAIVNGQGESVEPYDWLGKWSDKYYEDGGYEPPELRYRKSEREQLGYFDIAVTAEQTGGYKKTSFRRLVVSQKFRAVIEELGGMGIRYTPVRIKNALIC